MPIISGMITGHRTPSMDPYRSAAREARYPEIETEREPSVHPPPSDLEPRVNRHVPSRAP